MRHPLPIALGDGRKICNVADPGEASPQMLGSMHAEYEEKVFGRERTNLSLMEFDDACSLKK